jgi:hypothetical protein
MILSADMMVEHAGESDKAEPIKDAVAAVVNEGRLPTYDMMPIPEGANQPRHSFDYGNDRCDSRKTALSHAGRIALAVLPKRNLRNLLTSN